MGIVIIIVVSIMFACSLGVFIWAIILENNKKLKLNSTIINFEKLNEFKEILEESDSSTKCAEVGWSLVNSNIVSTPVTSNKRKLNYSDARESQRFCESITPERLTIIDKMDGATNYGRY